ncbi:MAG: hypothetical protein DRP65_09355 [Planctomycetota bacterium]|nr:MAG: hypothetical protein DRP65_09355 [Planctomycetota bacterium]
MGKKNEHMFCKGDGLSFGGQHVHYAKGYCFNEYQKARYRAKHPKPEIPPVPRICKGDGKLFNTDTHRHYAKGYCFAEYRKMRYQKQKAAKPKIPPMPRICKSCGMPVENGICSRCEPFIMAQDGIKKLIPAQCWDCKTALCEDNYINWGLCRSCFRRRARNDTVYKYLCWRCFSLDRKTLVRQKYSLCSECEKIIENEGAQSRRNMKARKTSRFRGVTWNKACNKWRAQINRQNDRRYLGDFDSEYDAACAYDAAVVRHDFTAVNFPQNFQLRRKKS